MKRLFVGLMLLFCLSSVAGAAEQTVMARVTVYWHGEGQSKARWKGVPLRDGHCAVDPHKIPYGSKVVVDGDELTAVDTGPAVVSRKAARAEARTPEQRNAIVVDRYFQSKEQALAWANSHPHFMPVRVVTASSDGGEATQAAPPTPVVPWHWVAGASALAAAALPIFRVTRRRRLA